MNLNITICLITIYVFLENLGYGIYEFKNNNKLGSVFTIILNLTMIIGVNYLTFTFS